MNPARGCKMPQVIECVNVSVLAECVSGNGWIVLHIHQNCFSVVIMVSAFRKSHCLTLNQVLYSPPPGQMAVSRG